jgi:cell division protein FtsQ
MKRQSVLSRQSVNVRKKRRVSPFPSAVRKAGSRLLKTLLVLVIVGATSLIFLCLYDYLLTSPYMRLEKVEMKGVDERIKKELLEMCDLDPDVGILGLKLNHLKEVIETHPWVRSVRLERRFPHTLIVEAEKQVPVALVLKDGMYYMNGQGEMFKDVSRGEQIDFPVVTGVTGEGAEAQEQLKRVAHVVRTLEGEEGLWASEELSEIHVRDRGEISLYFAHLKAEVSLVWSDLAKKMDGLKKVAEHLRQTGRIQQVTRIDLNHVDGAVVSFRKA